MMNDDSIMPFGKYKGKKMVDVPDSYLRWLLSENWFVSSKKPDYIKVYEYILDVEDTLE